MTPPARRSACVTPQRPDTPTVLVMAKAPVPGLAKTRLAASVGPRAAADLATDSLLDTLAAAAGTGWPVVVALTGDLDSATRADELGAALAGCTVIEQRGDGLGERLAAAHFDAMAVGGTAVVQIGSDTPQVEPADLVAAHDRLAGSDAVLGGLDAGLAGPDIVLAGHDAVLGPADDAVLAGPDAVLGPADDGGWWLLATRRPAVAECIAGVPMSRTDTGVRTIRALHAAGWRVGRTRRLRDVDTARDADAVARLAPATRFAARWADRGRAWAAGRSEAGLVAGRSEAALVGPGTGP